MKKNTIYILLLLLTINFIYAKTTVYHLNIIKSVQKSNYKTQYDLATKYRDGDGVEINFQKALHLYHLSALKGYPPAQYQLGMAFRYGLGVKANQELARYWIRKAARNNYAYAQEIFKRYYSKKRPIRQYQFTTIARY